MEGGWKTPPPRVSSRAKSPGLMGLNQKSQKGNTLQVLPLEAQMADFQRNLVVLAFLI